MAKLENVKIIDMVNGKPTRVEYNGAVYEKTEEKAKEGDLVRVIDAGYIDDVIQGGFYKVYADGDGGLSFDDENDFERDYDANQPALETFRKASVDLAERLAELERRLEALEERVKPATTPEAEAQAPKFEVGDYVVPLPESDEEYAITNMDMKLGKVTRVYSDGDIRIEIVAHEYDDAIGEDYRVEPKYFRKATDEEVAQVKAKTQPKFEVGNYVKLSIEDGKRTRFGWGGVKNGDIGKVVKIGCDGTVYVDFPNQEDWHADSSELVLVTEEEAKEIARWAKIGRKPGEFKKGDIVRVTDSCGECVKAGTITEVAYVDSDGDITARDEDGDEWYVEAELIVPVEQRFDITAEGARQ